MSTTGTAVPSPGDPIGNPIGNFDQPILAIGDPQTFNAVHTAIENSFSPANLVPFLKSLDRAGVRIRGFEDVVGKGLLGKTTSAEYARLDNADQGQIREYYLASLERVPMNLRDKFYKLYAYY